MVKKKYNTDLSEASLSERWEKAGGSINGLDAEGRDNTGEPVDYSSVGDLDDTTNYVKKVMDVVVGNNDQGNEE
jgi:hypothetical protein